MNLSISISPVGLGLVILVISNFLISLGKSGFMKKCYIILSSILSVGGILGIATIRFEFISRLNKRQFNPNFESWAITKFDSFATVSIWIISIIIIFLLYLLLSSKKNEDAFVYVNLPIFIIVLRVIILLTGVFYSIGTINKLFDISYYIGVLSIFEALALYIPLIARRIITF